MTSAFFYFFEKMLISASFTGRRGKYLHFYKGNIEYYHAAQFYLECSILRLDFAILNFADITKNYINAYNNEILAQFARKWFHLIKSMNFEVLKVIADVLKSSNTEFHYF